MDWDFITDDVQREKAKTMYDNAIIELNDQHKLELDEEVTGLKSKNAEILDEKKKAEKKLKKLDDYDFDAATEALEFFDANKDAQLIKDNKLDELIEKRTSALQSDHDILMDEINGKLDSSTIRGNKYEGLYKTKMVEDSLRAAAIVAKVRPEAVTDVLLHGRSVFALAEDSSVEARDGEGKLQKNADGKVLTPTNWIEGLRKTAPHYWPGSEGAGAHSKDSGGRDDIAIAMQRAADSGNQVEYRRLRNKQLAA